jgi:hypothetical protein
MTKASQSNQLASHLGKNIQQVLPKINCLGEDQPCRAWRGWGYVSAWVGLSRIKEGQPDRWEKVCGWHRMMRTHCSFSINKMGPRFAPVDVDPDMHAGKEISSLPYHLNELVRRKWGDSKGKMIFHSYVEYQGARKTLLDPIMELRCRKKHNRRHDGLGHSHAIPTSYSEGKNPYEW